MSRDSNIIQKPARPLLLGDEDKSRNSTASTLKQKALSFSKNLHSIDLSVSTLPPPPPIISTTVNMSHKDPRLRRRQHLNQSIPELESPKFISTSTYEPGLHSSFRTLISDPRRGVSQPATSHNNHVPNSSQKLSCRVQNSTETSTGAVSSDVSRTKHPMIPGIDDETSWRNQKHSFGPAGNIIPGISEEDDGVEAKFSEEEEELPSPPRRYRSPPPPEPEYRRNIHSTISNRSSESLPGDRLQPGSGLRQDFTRLPDNMPSYPAEDLDSDRSWSRSANSDKSSYSDLLNVFNKNSPARSSKSPVRFESPTTSKSNPTLPVQTNSSLVNPTSGLSTETQSPRIPVQNPLLTFFGIQAPPPPVIRDKLEDMKSVIEVRSDLFQNSKSSSVMCCRPPPSETPYVVYDNTNEDRLLSDALSLDSSILRPKESRSSERAIIEEASVANQYDDTLPIKLEPPEEKEQKMELKGMIRCSFCPSPSAVRIEDRVVHLDFHKNLLFSCAACPKRKEFDEFDRIVNHINMAHNVIDSAMVLETIILPSQEGALRVFKCGVRNCGKEFIGLPESELKSHMKSAHGDYYIKVGKGKYVLRLCRICGDDASFQSIPELDQHILKNHPVQSFGNMAELAGSGEEEEDDFQQNNADSDLTANLLEDLSRNRNTNRELANSAEMLIFGKAFNQATTSDAPVLFGKALPTESTEISFGKALPQQSEEAVFGKPLYEGAEKMSDKLLRVDPADTDQPEEGELVESADERGKRNKKRKKSRKHHAKEETEDEENNSDSENYDDHKNRESKSKKKDRKSTKRKNDSLENRVKKMSSKQLKTYMKELKKTLKTERKKKQKEIKKVSSDFPKTFRGVTAVYYCLICTEHVGSLKKWMEHRRGAGHTEALQLAEEEAKERFKSEDIDLQESVIAKTRCRKTPTGQCRECYKIFYNEGGFKKHMKSGSCPNDGEPVSDSEDSDEESRKINSPRRESDEPRRELSPALQSEANYLRDARGSSPGYPANVADGGRRNSTQTSSSAEPKSRQMLMPKFLVNGRQAYYFCKRCCIPIGTILHWYNHIATLEHMENIRMNGNLADDTEFSVSSCISPENYREYCLACNLHLDNRDSFHAHLLQPAHKEMEIRMEIRDGNELRQGGERFPAVYYCELCEESFLCQVGEHKKSIKHSLIISETEQCYFCPKRYASRHLVEHIDENHLVHVFKCLECVAVKYISAEKMITHVRTEHLSDQISKTCKDPDILKLGIIHIPEDLRKIECKMCDKVCFLAQDSTEPNSHVLNDHEEVAVRNVPHCLTFGCRLCSSMFESEKDMSMHIEFHKVLLNNKEDSIGIHRTVRREESLSPVIIRQEDSFKADKGNRAGTENAIHGHRSRSRSVEKRIRHKTRWDDGNHSGSEDHLRSNAAQPRSSAVPTQHRKNRSRSRDNDTKRQRKSRTPENSRRSRSPDRSQRYYSNDKRTNERTPRTAAEDRRTAQPPEPLNHTISRRFSEENRNRNRGQEEDRRQSGDSSKRDGNNRRNSRGARRDSARDLMNSESARKHHLAGNIQNRVRKKMMNSRKTWKKEGNANTQPLGHRADRTGFAKDDPDREESENDSDLDETLLPGNNSSKKLTPVKSGSKPNSGASEIQRRIREEIERNQSLDSVKSSSWTEADLKARLDGQVKPTRYDSAGTTQSLLEAQRESDGVPESKNFNFFRKIEIVQPPPPPPQSGQVNESALQSRLKRKIEQEDLRKVLEGKKMKILDSRPDGVKNEASLQQEDRRCPFCWKCVGDQDALLTHMKVSHAEQLFSCMLCKTVGWSVEILFKHLTDKHEKELSLIEALQRFIKIPRSLERINCKMCPPPYQLGGDGVWLCSDFSACIKEVEAHMSRDHAILEQSQVVSKVDLVCRCCTATFNSSQRKQWLTHLKSDHSRVEKKCEAGVRCDYCGEQVVETEKLWHTQTKHARDVFLCRICTASDTSCFPSADSLKEMMQHMVMKHGNEFESFYDHITYPVNLYRGSCTAADCAVSGKFLVLTELAIQAHKDANHIDDSAPPSFDYFCRCCDKAQQKFQTLEEVEGHIAKRHKQILKWKSTNGNNKESSALPSSPLC